MPHCELHSQTHECLYIQIYSAQDLLQVEPYLLTCKKHTHTHTLTYLCTPVCICTSLYSVISVQHLSEPGAVVNNPSPSREGPANEVNCMLLHCVTQGGWLAPQHGAPAHQGTVARFSATGSCCSDTDRFMNKRDRAAFSLARFLLLLLSLSLGVRRRQLLNAAIKKSSDRTGRSRMGCR